jgi:hypothetical protein
MELKRASTWSGSWEKDMVMVLPPVGKGIAAVPLAAQAVVGVGPATTGTVGAVVGGTGATVGVAAGVGPQAARSILVRTTSEIA